jgi:plasmid stability protein
MAGFKKMANLQVKDMDDRLYEALREKAKLENRSISQEVITIIEKYLSNPNRFEKSPVNEFLNLSGAWEDKRSADEIIGGIASSRTVNNRFGENNVLFD